ncbi:hypothetical protein J3A64_004039 [Pseudarthrobacter sp. PvP004]|uniref:hypothetical protein n=1 Tax=Pseudarthrobacter sp. PvP004 TaxID=2817850 RepID=UPI001AE22E64|nr:hypothetical protein [Pseudarthrobacter sp. PvP004]MBP2268575.1 hypothetical protein [Pseudarthrobacter sp. PvP004]
MSEQFAPRGLSDQRAIDHLLADAGLADDAELRTELLELRSLAGTAPLPSEAVRALMVGGPAAATQQIAAPQGITATQHITTADGPSAVSDAPTAVLATVAPEPAPVDELAARRRKKRRTAIAGLAVAVSLAGGATAAVASEGGLPGAFQHLGAAIGSVVSQLSPGSGSAPQPGAPAGTTPGPLPVREEPQQAPVPAEPQPTPDAPGNPAVPAPQPGPGGASPHTPKAPAQKDPGNGVIPTPPALPVTPPGIDPSKIDPSKLGPSGVPVPVPTQLIPSLPADPSIPAG